MIKGLYESVKQNKTAGKRYWSVQYKLHKLIANTVYPLIQRGNRERGVDAGHEIIVSLTTTPARIDKVWITLCTLLNQTYKPKRIILWLAKEQFEDETTLPKSLLAMQKRGVEIAWCEDLKPHKKYFYTIQQNPEEIIVTADDDVLYPENLLEILKKGHEKYPQAVCCTYAHEIGLTEDGKIAKYSRWKSIEEEDILSLRTMPVGCGGVLYPPHVLNEELFCKEKIQKLCFMMDDLWLKSMAVRNNTPAVKLGKGSLIYFDIVGTRKSGLQHSNAGQGQNDVAMEAICTVYPEVEQRLKQYG